MYLNIFLIKGGKNNQQRSMQRMVKMLFCGESWGKIDHFCYWGDRNFIEVDVGD